MRFTRSSPWDCSRQAERGRRALRVHIKGDLEAGLKRVAAADPVDDARHHDFLGLERAVARVDPGRDAVAIGVFDVARGGGDQAERPQARRGVLGADHDGQAGAFDVFVQQVNHALLLFHHLEERAKRGHRHGFGARTVEE